MRGERLSRFLLGLPGAVLGGTLVSGCCGNYEQDVIYSIDEADYRTLQSRFADEDLPEDVCSSLCLDRENPCRVGANAGGAGGAGGGSGESGSSGQSTGIDMGECSIYDLPAYTQVDSCHLTIVDETHAGVHCVALIPPDGCGRRPDGLAPVEGRAGAAGWLAAAAHLEAASVVAFERLARELALCGAPGALVHAARDAAKDERRHARTMTALARRHGVEPARARVARRAPRDLAAIAIENAAEGCVREAFGAVELAHAAEHAPDRRLRKAFARIAADEARHAAFSFALHDWAMTKLGRDDRRRAQRAMKRAAQELVRTRARVPTSLSAELGLPNSRRCGALLAASQTLWG
jgi:hypothetical protein